MAGLDGLIFERAFGAAVAMLIGDGLVMAHYRKGQRSFCILYMSWTVSLLYTW